MGYVSLPEVIATAQSVIKDATSQDKLLWSQWIGLMALPVLGIDESDIKVVTLYPNNFSAPKPADLKAVIDVALYDSTGCQLRHIYRAGGPRIYKDERIPRTAVVQPADPSQQLGALVPVDISDTNFTFELGTNGDLVAKIIVRYFAYMVDDVGLPLIDQFDAQACVYYVIYMNSLRKNENQSEIRMNEQRWMREADRCRARKKANSLTNEKMKHIVRGIWTRAIPNFNFDLY